MARITHLIHEFVDSFPAQLEEGKLYVSIKFASSTHKCCCGCGLQVVTPISPVGWKLTFDGESISLDPSIGNWSFPCKSHYWIKNNQVNWAEPWSKKEINELRQDEAEHRQQHYQGKRQKPARKIEAKLEKAQTKKPKRSLIQTLKQWVTPE